jgi:hypothetical protein
MPVPEPRVFNYGSSTWAKARFSIDFRFMRDSLFRRGRDPSIRALIFTFQWEARGFVARIERLPFASLQRSRLDLDFDGRRLER